VKDLIVQGMSRLAFGDDPLRRPGLSRSLTATTVYLICLVAQWATVGLGQSDASNARWLTVYCVFGAFGFFIVIRSGLTEHAEDTALTVPQMIFAIVAVALGYRLNPHMPSSRAGAQWRSACGTTRNTSIRRTSCSRS
jgi:hypothetical protein